MLDIEVIKNYITVYAEGSYTVKRTLKEIERKMDERFLRGGGLISSICILFPG